jgi:hypothetical protein
MAVDFYNLTDIRNAALLYTLSDKDATELGYIFIPARQKWGDIISIGKDTRILASQMGYLLELIEQSGKGGQYTEFCGFLRSCQAAGIDLRIYAD